jgi:hypothetical protein
MSESLDWEAICCRCGRCCYEKIEFDGKVYYTDIPCDRLDPETRLCTVYVERDRQRQGCRRLNPDLIRQGLLPGDCPYVAGIDDYPSPQMWDGKKRIP